jgi:catechol 2,3-dioxygenase-like lactoylglutathione lyase family enzyme
MARFERAVPVLQVADVGRSIDWYVATFGFDPNPFPATPPYGFAILRRDTTEMMLQHGEPSQTRNPNDEGWAVYLRVGGEGLLQLAERVRKVAPLVRGPELAFYGLVEFEVMDPDGHRICVSGAVPKEAAVPDARDCEPRNA